MKKTFAALALAASLIPFAGAQAAVISFSNSVGMQITDWDEVLSFKKFDTNLGTLTAIQFDLSGVMEGSGKAENKSGKAAKVSMTLGSALELMRPDGSSLVLTTPVFNKLFEFSGYDRTEDYDGASGGSTGKVAVGGAESYISSNASDFALFSTAGNGFIDLGLSASGVALTSGSANLAVVFENYASSTATVTYTYTPFAEVPEPASMAMVLAGFGLMGAVRGRKAGKKA